MISVTKKQKILVYTFLVIISLLSIFPIYWMACAATNTSVDIMRGKLIPGGYLIENFKSLIGNQDLGRAFVNSVRNSVLLTLFSMIICSIAGYGFEVYHQKSKDILFTVLLTAMMLPFVAIMIPLFTMFSKAGMVNSWLAFMLPGLSTPFLIMMFRSGYFLYYVCTNNAFNLWCSCNGNFYEYLEQLSVAKGNFPEK